MATKNYKVRFGSEFWASEPEIAEGIGILSMLLAKMATLDIEYGSDCFTFKKFEFIEFGDCTLAQIQIAVNEDAIDKIREITGLNWEEL